MFCLNAATRPWPLPLVNSNASAFEAARGASASARRPSLFRGFDGRLLLKLLRGFEKEPKEGDAPPSFGLFRSAKVQPVDNGLRHSFASYWLARSGKEGFGGLARIMGNSEAVVRKHYVEVLSPGDGEAWFGITREA